MIESDGRVTFKYHQEARQDKELPRNASDTSDIRPKIRVGLASAKYWFKAMTSRLMN